MPGENIPGRELTAKEHATRAEGLLVRSANTDQSPDGFRLAQALATEAVGHALLAAYHHDRDRHED